ncbi:MAG: hypothetical protein DI551_05325 [Micavibrio aeruginosavorus]|uniref:Uncharacterized protein n=1 Tax=Micavibrio aeruginosavorus TaxID=349221 RepID=A0A2W5PNQ9_9BACT|nr:MAG: hypothetical protein DI551_05325 [Micavibrio aeruginosavorus]
MTSALLEKACDKFGVTVTEFMDLNATAAVHQARREFVSMATLFGWTNWQISREIGRPLYWVDFYKQYPASEEVTPTSTDAATQSPSPRRSRYTADVAAPNSKGGAR